MCWDLSRCHIVDAWIHQFGEAEGKRFGGTGGSGGGEAERGEGSRCAGKGSFQRAGLQVVEEGQPRQCHCGHHAAALGLGGDVHVHVFNLSLLMTRIGRFELEW